MFFTSVFFFAFCLTWLILIYLVPFLTLNLLDVPNKRSSHKVSTPRGGGVVFVLIALISCISFLLSGSSFRVLLPLLIPIPLAFVGLIDDKFSLSPKFRYLIQLFTSLALLFSLYFHYYDSFVLSNLILLVVFVPILLTFVINAVNFMDGIDGLVAGSLFFALASVVTALGYASFYSAFLGSLLCFLIWNWSPAKLFMGDVGSTYLGALYGGIVLLAPSWQMCMQLLLLLFPLLGDTSICIFRRLIAGHNIFTPHRLHLYQRLTLNGWSHPGVSCIYISGVLILSLAFYSGSISSFYLAIFFELLVGIILDRRYAVPFSFVVSKGSC